MRIQHNIMAMNAYRNYNTNNNALSKNLEKLSSGYAINRAGDDAAGLAISEKMRAQITGLSTAQDNAQSGINLVQTAEGAMTEVHDMLNRMYELANQSANGTYDEIDREQLQKELDQLSTEIDRIADSTNFNGIDLLDGSLDSGKVTTVTADSAISGITTDAYAPNGASDAFSTTFIQNRPKAATVQTNAKFSISLDDIQITGADATDKVTISIGDATLNYDLVAGDITNGVVNSDKLATGLANSGNAKTAGTENTDGDKNGSLANGFTGVTNTGTNGAGNYIKIDGHIWKMTANDDSIDFEQVDYMGTTGDVVNPSYNVQVSTTDVDNTNGTAAVSGTVNWQAQKTVQGVGVGSSNQAQVTVGIDFSKLKDGDKLVAGDKTYVFKIGKDSTTSSGAGETLIDLHDIFEEASDLANEDKQLEAMNKIVAGMGGSGSTTWSVGNGSVADGKGTLTLQSLSSYVDDTTGIAGNSNNAKINMETEANILKQFYGLRPESGASVSFNLDVTKIKAGDSFTIDGKTFEFTDGSDASSSNRIAINLSTMGIAGGLLESQTGDVMETIKTAIGDQFKLGDGSSSKYTVTIDGDKMTLSSNDDAITTSVFENRTAASITLPTISTTGAALTLQIGDTSDAFNQLSVDIQDMHVGSLGIENIDISTQEGAAKATDLIKNAINIVSDVRGTLGATQNRLEHTINSLSVSEENITSSESSIRDTDVAEEMMAYTKNNILIQSAQAMLAQANQVPQGVLQLLG